MCRLLDVNQFKYIIDTLNEISDSVSKIEMVIDSINHSMDNLIIVIGSEFGDDYIYQEVLCDYCWYYDFGRDLDKSNSAYNITGLAPVVGEEDVECMKSPESLYNYLIGIHCESIGDDPSEAI